MLTKCSLGDEEGEGRLNKAIHKAEEEEEGKKGFFIWKAALLMHKKELNSLVGSECADIRRIFFIFSQNIVFSQKMFYFLSTVTAWGLRKKPRKCGKLFLLYDRSLHRHLPPPS